ncbi:exported hypothetical protein [Gammaproteobacteria bacterium]
MKIKNKPYLKNALLLTLVFLLSACAANHAKAKLQKDGGPTIDDINMSLQEAYITENRKDIERKGSYKSRLDW